MAKETTKRTEERPRLEPHDACALMHVAPGAAKVPEAALKGIEAAILEARRRLAAILSDRSGLKLDAVGGVALLPPLPEVEAPAKRRRRA